MAKISLVIDQSHSLKEKRMVLRRIKDRVAQRARVHLSEVGSQDVWQRAELGGAVASSDRGKVLEVIDEVVRLAMSAGGAQIVSIAKDVTTFDGEPVPFTPIDDRTGTGDKAQGGDDWVPDEWRDQVETSRRDDEDPALITRSPKPRSD
jgi:uncharacterized protein YlxP (DUF503 family)